MKGRKEKITQPKSPASLRQGIWSQLWNWDKPWTSGSLGRSRRNWFPQQRTLECCQHKEAICMFIRTHSDHACHDYNQSSPKNVFCVLKF